jgi:hypothetical protein
MACQAASLAAVVHDRQAIEMNCGTWLSDICVHLDPHLIWQATKRYVDELTV